MSSFFQLVLRIPFKLTPHAINKSLGVFEVFLEKSFEIKPRDKSSVFVVVLMLILLETNNVTDV